MNVRQAAKFEATAKKKALMLAILETKSESDPVTGKALAAMIGVTNDVTVRALCNELRQESFPVCSSDKGYWLGRTSVEINATIADLRGRIHAVECAISGLVQASLRLQCRNAIIIDGEIVGITPALKEPA
jgi:hypothetical protein